MAWGGLKSYIKDKDSFDRKAEFTFKTSKNGYETSVKSTFGGSATMVYYFIFLTCIIVKTKELFAGHEDADHQVTTSHLDDSEPIDLYALGYNFAVPSIEAKKGRITAEQVEWKSFRGDAYEQITEIPMVSCKELMSDPENINDSYINNKAFNPYDQTLRTPTEFLCPNTTSLLVHG